MQTSPLAHSGGHGLQEHLAAVAALAQRFAREFVPHSSCNSDRWAWLAGLWHDLGKYRPGFQRYVQLADNPDAHIEGKVGGREKTHSAAGAIWAMQQINKPNQPYGNVLAYLIAGHHAGLDDWDGGLKERLQSEDAQLELRQALAADPPVSILAHGDLVAQIPGGASGFALWVRMLFSCLVDADFLDTEAHFDAGKPGQREGFPTLEQMRQAFDARMAALVVRAKNCPKNISETNKTGSLFEPIGGVS